MVLAERWLYPAVAQHYHTGSLDIKRSICFAVDLIWKQTGERCGR